MGDNKIEPSKRTTSKVVTSLLNNLDNSKDKLYSSKQTRKYITEMITNSGVKSDLKTKYILKLEKLLDRGVNQIEVIGSIIYSIKEDFSLLNTNDCEITSDTIDRE